MPNDTLGSRIREFRTNLGLTQAELAEDVGLSRKQLGKIERGVTKHPHPATLLRIAERLEMTVPELTGSLSVAEARIVAAIAELRERLGI